MIKRVGSQLSSGDLHEVTDFLSQYQVADVLIPGFYGHDDRTSFPVFHPQSMSIYLVADEGIIVCESVGQYDQLRMKIASQLHLNVVADEDDEIGLASIFELLFGDAYGSVRCTHLRYFTDPRSDPSGGVVKCVELCFEGSKTLFLDPTYTFGIGIGNTEQRDSWLKNYFNDSDQYSEHWWRRIEG